MALLAPALGQLTLLSSLDISGNDFQASVGVLGHVLGQQLRGLRALDLCSLCSGPAADAVFRVLPQLTALSSLAIDDVDDRVVTGVVGALEHAPLPLLEAHELCSEWSGSE